MNITYFYISDIFINQNMFSRSKKMIALINPPLDSGSSEEDDELEVDPLEIDHLLVILDEDLVDEVITCMIIVIYLCFFLIIINFNKHFRSIIKC